MNGQLIKVHSGLELLSPMADAYFKFDSDSKVTLLTTGFTRLRLPIVLMEKSALVEKVVLMTSHDRAVVAAKSSRQLNEVNVLGDSEQNTQLVFQVSGDDLGFSVEVHSAGQKVNIYKIEHDKRNNSFVLPKKSWMSNHQPFNQKHSMPLWR